MEVGILLVRVSQFKTLLQPHDVVYRGSSFLVSPCRFCPNYGSSLANLASLGFVLIFDGVFGDPWRAIVLPATEAMIATMTLWTFLESWDRKHLHREVNTFHVVTIVIAKVTFENSSKTYRSCRFEPPQNYNAPIAVPHDKFITKYTKIRMRHQI